MGTQHPLKRPMSIVTKLLPISATAEHVVGVKIGIMGNIFAVLSL